MADYVRHRPSYPPELFAWLRETIGFSPSWRVADIGSGTGIFTRLLLEQGNPVHAVEPNDAMRAAAESLLAGRPRFVSVAGSAEATTLPDHAFELITAAQAFHWFDAAAAKREFQRILVPDGWGLIAFNTRRIDASPWMRAYEAFLCERAVDYKSVDHRLVEDSRLRPFLGDYRTWRFHWAASQTIEGIVGFSASSSYTPAPDHPSHESFYAALRELFAAHQADGRVEVLYETEVYVGQIT